MPRVNATGLSYRGPGTPKSPVSLYLIQRTALALLVALTFAACKATVEDIETWKGTMKGPGKIVAVLKSENYDLALRSRAALALVEMAPRTQPEPLDPLAELQRAIQRLDDHTRGQIIGGTVPGLEKLLSGAETTPEQIRAKDAAFLLVPHASPALRDRLTDAVMGWYVADFNGRNLAGNYSAQQVIEQLGAPAAENLVNAINREMPEAALVKLAEMIAQLGTPTAKAKAGQRLVELQTSMEGAEFLTWIENKIKESNQAQWGDKVAGPGAQFAVNQEGKLVLVSLPPDSAAARAGLKVGDVLARIDGQPAADPNEDLEKLFGATGTTLALGIKRGGAEQNVTVTRGPRFVDEQALAQQAEKVREERITDGTLLAMKHLNGVPAVAARLLAIAERSSTGDGDPLTLRRERALLALEGAARPEDLSRLLDLALSTETPLGVRDVAFDRVGDIRSKDAIPRIWPLLQNDSYENGGQRLRWRAGEMILYIGGPAIVREFFERLPSAAGRFEPEELEGYAQRMSQMTPPPTALLRSQLQSPNWWQQVIALRYFERKGEASMLRVLESLKRVRVPVNGDAWSRLELSTVGDVAGEASQGLRERLSDGGSSDEGVPGEG